jgi:serine phosphatase RsbU (regulator of sigma subunit)
MTGREIDYAAVFQAVPSPLMLLSPDLLIADVNQAYTKVSGRERQELLSQYLFDAFPDNPQDPQASGERNLRASLHRVLSTGERDTMALQKYDVEVAGIPGVFEERWWSAVNAPVFGPDGEVALIIHRVEEVTPLIRERLSRDRRHDGPPKELQVMEAELYVRGQELQELNERLRQAHAHQREVALTLQQAMLPGSISEHDHFAAVRYLPATGSLNVCGDWYDLVELGGGRTAVAVGDVVGQGLAAAGVMGQLRSALSAAVRAVSGPARALDILSLYARATEGALAATAVQVVIDQQARTIGYSCAGHPPPMLARADGTVDVLDQATDPPLGATPEHVPRPQAVIAYAPGDILVLYTDGLVERRGEDIDAGLNRLADSLARHRRLAPEPLADALLGDLGATGGTGDDTALVVIRLPGETDDAQ